MQSGPYRQDQPSRDGGADRPTDAQLEGATADGSPTPNAGIEDATNGGDLLEIELNAERDRNLRLRAEIENLRTRSSRELADQIRYAALPMARDLLPVLDNIDRALAAVRATCERFACERIEVVSGYRSAKMNEMLRKKGRHVAQRSQHPMATAVDFRLVGIEMAPVFRWLERGHDGGVGRYRDDAFVHVDAGPRRRWRGE